MTMWSRFRDLTLLVTVAVVTLGMAQGREIPRVQLKYLGTAGWEITDGKTVVLVDPFLSRPRMVTPNDDTLPTDTRPLLTADDIATSSVVDAHIQRADLILITHTHFDHALDMPYIAHKAGATVIGTESTYNYARSSGITGDKLMVVRGGGRTTNSVVCRSRSSPVCTACFGMRRFFGGIQTRPWRRHFFRRTPDLRSVLETCASKAERSRTSFG